MPEPLKGRDRGTDPKVLIVAEHASAHFGGEALVPFQLFKTMRQKGADVHLLVHERTKSELLASFPADHDRIFFVPDSFVNIFCYQLGRLLPARISDFTTKAVSHLNTQIRQRRVARALVKTGGFHLVHEPIPVSPKLPSALTDLSAPLIIGPMNGGMNYPPNFDPSPKLQNYLITALRNSSELMNLFFGGKREASLLLVANKRTLEALPRIVRKRPIQELTENGVDIDLFTPRGANAAQGKTLKILCTGRLVDVKRVDLLLDACAALDESIDFELSVVGDGPLRSSLESQAAKLGLTKRVRFLGQVSHAGVAQLTADADVFVLTSMRECGGAVVLEAMACGLPVIATDWGGPQDYITPECGMLITPGTPSQFVADLAAALAWMAKHPDERVKMGVRARRHVEINYAWKSKIETLMRIYADVIANSVRG